MLLYQGITKHSILWTRRFGCANWQAGCWSISAPVALNPLSSRLQRKELNKLRYSRNAQDTSAYAKHIETWKRFKQRHLNFCLFPLQWLIVDLISSSLFLRILFARIGQDQFVLRWLWSVECRNALVEWCFGEPLGLAWNTPTFSCCVSETI